MSATAFPIFNFSSPLRTLWLVLCLTFCVGTVKAQESTGTPVVVTSSTVGAPVQHAVHVPAVHQAEEKHEGLPLFSPVLFRAGPFVVTSSMVLCWGAALTLILFCQLATRNIRPVPSGPQNFWEFLIEGLYDFLGGIVGPDLVKKTFWFFATVFIFILISNWFGLIPGVGTIGWGHHVAGHGFELEKPLLRGGNADLNMTLAIAMIFFVLWTIWGVQFNGPGGFVFHIFGPKGESKGFMKLAMIILFAFVGVLETISIAFRPVSLSFRLYGNVFAGENLLEAMTGMSHYFGWLIALPFYFLELLVGLVQALVFMLLTSVFTALICTHEGGDHAEHH